MGAKMLCFRPLSYLTLIPGFVKNNNVWHISQAEVEKEKERFLWKIRKKD
jgi:hypothetical protein